MTETASKKVADTLAYERPATNTTSTVKTDIEKALCPNDITEDVAGNSPTFSRHLQDSFRKRLNSLDIAGTLQLTGKNLEITYFLQLGSVRQSVRDI